jgi:hypothetical protein
LARLKKEGRIEVIRERNANFHAFAFIDGVRPSDDLITASLEKAGAPPPEEETAAEPAKPKQEKVLKAQHPRSKSRATHAKRVTHAKRKRR